MLAYEVEISWRKGNNFLLGVLKTGTITTLKQLLPIIQIYWFVLNIGHKEAWQSRLIPRQCIDLPWMLLKVKRVPKLPHLQEVP